MALGFGKFGANNSERSVAIKRQVLGYGLILWRVDVPVASQSLADINFRSEIVGQGEG